VIIPTRKEPVMAKTEAATNAKAADATALLKADHRLVEGLFEQYEKAKGKAQKASLAQKICLELSVHTAVEEEVFYPSLRGEAKDDTLDEAHVEHDGAKVLIAELMEGSPDDDFYDAKVKVLSEEIKHHVKEEEKPEGLFAQAKKADVDLKRLGQEILVRKEALSKTFEERGIPTPQTRTMKGAKLKVGRPVQ